MREVGHFFFFNGATAPGGPWPPLQYASKPLDPLLCLSVRLFPSFSGPWTRHPTISFLVVLFVLLHTAFRTTFFFVNAVSCILSWSFTKFKCSQWNVLTTVNLASSNSALPDDGDYTETCWSCFNFNFNTLLKSCAILTFWRRNYFFNFSTHCI